MATQILSFHWKAIRMGLIPFVVAAFALPLLSVQGLGGSEASVDAYRAVQMFQIWLPIYPMLAAALGTTLALSAWNWDHQSGHVYALSLPIPRWEYALLKFGSGMVLALIPVGAFLLGSLAASASVSLPAGLHAYPVELTFRFLFATLLIYAFFFALAAGTMRTAVIVLSCLVAGPLLAQWGADFVVALSGGGSVDVVGRFYRALVEAPGPFEIFTGSWMLIDV